MPISLFSSRRMPFARQRQLHPSLRTAAWLAVAALATAGIGCSSDDSAKKEDKKPTSSASAAEAQGPVQDVNVPATDESITTIRAERHFASATKALEGDAPNLANAKAELQKAAEADPAFGIARYNLGVLSEKEGDVVTATRHYRAAFDADPGLDIAALNLGIILESRGQVDAARELYIESIEKNPEAVGTRLRLATLFRRDNDHRSAAKLAREALQFDAKSIEAYRLLARLYAEKKRNELASLIAIRGMKLQPDDPELRYALALVAMNNRDVAGGRALLKQVIDADKNHVDARTTLTELALKNRDWKTATVQLEALTALDPQNAPLQVNLGMAYKGQGKFAEAKTAYEKAISLDASLPEPYLNLGVVLLRNLNEPDAAGTALESYIAIASGKTKQAEKLLEEARLLVRAKVQEDQMMKEMAAQEAAAQAEAKAAEEAAKAAAANAEKNPSPAGDSAESAPKTEKPPASSAPIQPAERPEDDEASAEAPPAAAPAEKAPKPKPKAKRSRRKAPKAKPKAPPAEKPKATAPEEDDDFFDD